MSGLGAGFRVGHWTNPSGPTGCTVILPPPGNVSSCDIRGSSPGSRELELLHPERKLTEIHGLLLTGGSAFGLAAAEGVMRWLSEHDVGYATAAAKIPIVPAAVVLDMGTADPRARPDLESGWKACEDAVEEEVPSGRVGAGTGCTIGKWAGFEHRSPGGLGIATVEEAGAQASALAVVNSVGDVVAEDGSVVAGTTSPDPTYQAPPSPDVPANTVLAVVTVRANLDKRDVRFLASRGSDGITVAVRPAHTRYDGDVVFAIAAPADASAPPAPLDVLGFLATRAVAKAIRNAVSPSP